MIIRDIDLDEFDREEYIHFIKSLIDYYYILFNDELFLKGDNDEY